MHAVILAGGKGTRLSPFTKVFPKPLVPVGGKPILDTILRQLKHFGFRRVTLTVGYMAELLQTYVRDGSQYGLEIDYSFEAEPLGTAGPLAHIHTCAEHVLVMNGDIITDLDFQDIMRFHAHHNAMATIGTYHKRFKIDLGIIHHNDDHAITDYVEKPTYSFKVSMGVYVFNLAVLQYISPNSHLDFPDLVKELLAHNEKVLSYPFDGYWQDIGNQHDYEQALEDFESMRGTLHID